MYIRFRAIINSLLNRKSLLIIYALLTICLLFWVVTTGFNNQYAGDDLIFLKFFNVKPVHTVVYEYFVSFTGRITNLTVIGVLFRYFPSSILEKLSVLLSIGSLYLSLAILLRSITYKFKTSFVLIHSLSATICLALYAYGLATYDNFYWVAGISTYVIPLVLFNLILAYFIHKNKFTAPNSNIIKSIGLCLVIVVCSLFNEAFSIQVLSLTFAIAIYLSIKYRKIPLSLITIGVGYLLGLFIMRFAPGTRNRIELGRSYNPQIENFTDVMRLTGSNSIVVLKDFIGSNYAPILITVLISVAVGYSFYNRVSKSLPRKPTKPIEIVITILSGCLAAISQFIIVVFVFAYSQGSGVTNYAFLTASYMFYLVMSLVLMWTGYQIGAIRLSREILSKVVFSYTVLALIFGSIFIFHNMYVINKNNHLLVLQKLETIETRSEIEQQLANGSQNVLLEDSKFYFTYCVPDVEAIVWCNETLTQYYGLKSIKAKTVKRVGPDNVYINK